MLRSEKSVAFCVVVHCHLTASSSAFCTLLSAFNSAAGRPGLHPSAASAALLNQLGSLIREKGGHPAKPFRTPTHSIKERTSLVSNSHDSLLIAGHRPIHLGLIRSHPPHASLPPALRIVARQLRIVTPTLFQLHLTSACCPFCLRRRTSSFTQSALSSRPPFSELLSVVSLPDGVFSTATPPAECLRSSDGSFRQESHSPHI
jgi:hypothetical protein